MVNLRYHVVSLVAVFLALAIGVVLGAGPLQQTISAAGDGNDLSQQVTSLKQQLASSEVGIQQQETYIDSVASEVLPGSLAGRSVALILLPGVSANEVEQISAMIGQAGGDVVANVQLTDAWISLAQREYRDTLSVPVSSYLANPATGGTSDDILATALTQILTTDDGEKDLVRDILTDEKTPLVTASSLPAAPVQSLILVGPSTPQGATSQGAADPAPDPTSDAAQSGDSEVADQALVALGNALGAAPEGAVAVGSATAEGQLIQILRAAGVLIPTVDQAGTSMGSLNTVLALVAGKTGAYGQEEGAKDPVAPFPGE